MRRCRSRNTGSRHSRPSHSRCDRKDSTKSTFTLTSEQEQMLGPHHHHAFHNAALTSDPCLPIAPCVQQRLQADAQASLEYRCTVWLEAARVSLVAKEMPGSSGCVTVSLTSGSSSRRQCSTAPRPCYSSLESRHWSGMWYQTDSIDRPDTRSRLRLQTDTRDRLAGVVSRDAAHRDGMGHNHVT